MWLLNETVPLMQFNQDQIDQSQFNRGWESTVAVVLIVTGLFLDLWCAVQFFRAKTTVNPLRPENSSSLVVQGMYRLTRNPMYLGMLLVLTGVAFLLGSLSPFLVLPVFIAAINYLQIFPEERALTELFGASYLEYRQSVRRWL